MTNEEILKKAIEKAEKNGYEVPNPLSIIEDTPELIIFSHKFAKAFWGEEWPLPGKKLAALDYGPYWKYHLQIMVLEENPIKYLEKFLD